MAKDINGDVWMTKYKIAKKYKRKFGNLYIPYKFKMDGVAIGSWLATQRNAYKNHSSYMTNEKIKLLEELGIDWNNKDNPNYINSHEKNKMYFTSATKYYNKNKHLDVPIDYIDENGVELGHWIQSIRKTYSSVDEDILLRHPDIAVGIENRLSETNIKTLNSLSMIWKAENYDDWAYKYSLAKEFYENNGHLLIPVSFVCNDESNTNLGIWISYQRQLFNTGKKISNKKISMLNEIGMVWNPREELWESKYLLAKKFYKENGHLKIPKNYVVDNCNLGKWILWQRQARKGNVRNSLSKEKIKKLDSIGMIWN